MNGGMGDGGGVLPFPLGQGDGDGGLEVLTPATARQEGHVLIRLGRAVLDGGHVPEPDGPVVHDRHHHLTHIVGIPEKVPDANGHASVSGHQVPGRKVGVRGAKGLENGSPREPPGRQGLGIQGHGNLPGRPTDDPGLGHVGNPLQLGRQLHGLLPKQIPIPCISPSGEGEGEDGHFVDAVEGDEGRRGSRRNLVHVGHELPVQPGQSHLRLRSHLEPGRHHGAVVLGHRVDVVQVGDFPDGPLQGLHQAPLHLFGRCSGHAHRHVDHGNPDLGLLLPRRAHDRPDPQDQGEGREEGRQLRVEESLGDSPRESGFHWAASLVGEEMISVTLA